MIGKLRQIDSKLKNTQNNASLSAWKPQKNRSAREGALLEMASSQLDADNAAYEASKEEWTDEDKIMAMSYLIPSGEGAAIAGRMISRFLNKGAVNFFKGAKYSPKVLQQMQKADDLYHAFPKSVDGFATRYGQSTIKIGGDDKTYQMLRMQGSYGGKTGTFEWIKDADGIINHRFLNVPQGI